LISGLSRFAAKHSVLLLVAPDWFPAMLGIALVILAQIYQVAVGASAIVDGLFVIATVKISLPSVRLVFG
jgi:hypothetical protein